MSTKADDLRRQLNQVRPSRPGRSDAPVAPMMPAGLAPTRRPSSDAPFPEAPFAEVPISEAPFPEAPFADAPFADAPWLQDHQAAPDRAAPRPPTPPSPSNRFRRQSDHESDPAPPEYLDEANQEPLPGRPTPSLQRTWIDPEETPFEPRPRPGNPFAARMLSWVFTLLLVGAIAWLVVPEISFRFATSDTLVLRDGVLTAQPVPLAPTRPATVTELYVDASALADGVLREGTPIALLERIDVRGEEFELFEVRAPFDARFVSVDSHVGTVVLPGTPVATLYDPTKMYVIVRVVPELLEQLRRGMTVELKSSVIDQPISGTVISAVPLLGTDHEPTSADLVNVRIRPDASRIVDFVPGIHFDAAIHLDSVGDDAQPLVFTNAEHFEPTNQVNGETGGA